MPRCGAAQPDMPARSHLDSEPVFSARRRTVHRAAKCRYAGQAKGSPSMTVHAPLFTPSAAAPLDGKVALVTGSTSGIGLGIARALAAAGAAVMLNGFGRGEDIAEARARMIAEFRRDIRHSPADLASAAAIAGMIAMTLDTFGRLDILVNNARIQHVAPLEQFPPQMWDTILAINLSAAFHTTRLALPAMRQNGFGRIINIASADGLVAAPFKSASVAARHGLIGLTKATALEAAETNITCNAICGTVDAIGAVTVFLAGDTAASITGAALPVDGGWSARPAPRA
jgi:3-hydroxybutyrate dehydrogenase